MNASADPHTAPGNSRKTSLFKHLASVVLGIMTSRIFGLARDIISASFWGASGVAQAAFNTAWAVPNSLRHLFGEGAFTAAFVPMLSSRLTGEDRTEAWKLAEKAISVQAIVLFACTFLVSLFSVGMYCLEPWQFAPHIKQLYLILPILMPYALLICMAGSFASIMNSLNHFSLPSHTPVIFNIVQIATIGYIALFWKNTETTALLIFSASTILAGLLQLLVLMLAARRLGFCFHFHPDWKDHDVILLCRRILPGLVGSGVMQINSLADKIIGAYLGQEAVGALTYSMHLMNLPVSLFGTALATVSLPALSRAWSQKDTETILDTLNSSFRFTLFLTLPTAAALVILRFPLVQIFFQRGAFTMDATAKVATALAFYMTGLPAYCGVKIAAAAFHSRQDTHTPVVVSSICMILNIVLNIILMQFLKQNGLALSTSLCSWLNVSLLLWLNRKYLANWRPTSLLPEASRLLLATVVMGAVLLVCLRLSVNAQGFLPTLLRLAFSGASGGLAFLATGFLLRSQALREILRTLRRRTK